MTLTTDIQAEYRGLVLTAAKDQDFDRPSLVELLTLSGRTIKQFEHDVQTVRERFAAAELLAESDVGGQIRARQLLVSTACNELRKERFKLEQQATKLERDAAKLRQRHANRHKKRPLAHPYYGGLYGQAKRAPEAPSPHERDLQDLAKAEQRIRRFAEQTARDLGICVDFFDAKTGEFKREKYVRVETPQDDGPPQIAYRWQRASKQQPTDMYQSLVTGEPGQQRERLAEWRDLLTKYHKAIACIQQAGREIELAEQAEADAKELRQRADEIAEQLLLPENVDLSVVA